MEGTHRNDDTSKGAPPRTNQIVGQVRDEFYNVFNESECFGVFEDQSIVIKSLNGVITVDLKEPNGKYNKK